MRPSFRLLFVVARRVLITNVRDDGRVPGGKATTMALARACCGDGSSSPAWREQVKLPGNKVPRYSSCVSEIGK